MLPMRLGLDLRGVKTISSVFAGSAKRPFLASQVRACSRPCMVEVVAVEVVLETLNIVLSST